jgi:hypothetical protein
VRGTSGPSMRVRHQQPAGQALFQLAAAIGNRRLRGLNEEVVGTAQQRAMQADALIHGLAQMGCTDALRAAYSLHVCLMRGAIMAEHERQSSHAFPTNDADLDASLAPEPSATTEAKPRSMK